MRPGSEMNPGSTACPLGGPECAAIYSRLSRMGARVFALPRGEGIFRDSTDEETLAVAGEQSRFDYRLLYVLVAFAAEHFKSLHPFLLREAIGKMRTPAVWGVIAEFAGKITQDPDLLPFFSIVLHGTRPAPPQLYYMTQRPPKPEQDLKIALLTPVEFSGWGFYSDEIPILKELAVTGAKASFPRASRLGILRDLLENKIGVAVSDYLEALGHSITRQQAYKDLISFPRIKFSSDRRGRRYRL